MNGTIIKSIFSYASSNVLVQVLNFCSTLLLMKYLPLESFGVIGTLTEILALFMVVGESGVRNFFINKLRNKENIFHCKIVAFTFQSINSIILILIFFSAFYFTLTDVHVSYLIITLFFSGLYILTVPAQAAYLVLGRRKEMIIKDLCVAVLRFLFMSVLVGLNSGHSVVDVSVVLLMWLFPVLISFVYLNYKWFTGVNLDTKYSSVKEKITIKFYKNEFYLMMTFIIISVVNGIYNRIGVFILQKMNGAQSVAIYIGAAKFVLPTVFILMAFSNSLVKTFTNSESPIFDKKYAAACLIPAFFIFGALNSIFPYIFSNFFDKKFETSIYVLNVMSIYVPVVFSYGIFSSYLVINGFQKIVLGVNFCALIAVVLFSLLLIPIYEELGLAYSFIIVESLVCISYYCVIWSKKMSPSIFFMLSPIYGLCFCLVNVM